MEIIEAKTIAGKDKFQKEKKIMKQVPLHRL